LPFETIANAAWQLEENYNDEDDEEKDGERVSISSAFQVNRGRLTDRWVRSNYFMLCSNSLLDATASSTSWRGCTLALILWVYELNQKVKYW